MLEAYLQEQQNKLLPFEILSDDDLLASNYDVSSKALQMMLVESDRTQNRLSNEKNQAAGRQGSG
jgi:hypothetical protein